MTERMIATVPVFRSLAEIPGDFGPSIAAIGNFDGVHRGHREILGAAATEARNRGMKSVAITFDPHPAQLLYPKDAPKLLTFLPQRIELMARTGVDAIFVLPFNAELSRVSGHDFVKDILVGRLRIRGIHEGAEAADESAKMESSFGSQASRISGELKRNGLSTDVRTFQANRTSPRNEVEGVVQKVDGNMVEISIGSDDGLVVGNELDVYHLTPTPEYLGRIRIEGVDNDHSVGRVIGRTVQGKKIKEHDIVSTKIRSRS